MKNMQEFLDRHKNADDIAFELIRIFLGVALFIRGLLFVMNQSAVMELVEQRGMDWLFPMAAIHYITLAHLCGGFMLMIGLLTRVAAFLQIPVLIGAVFFVHLQDGLFNQGQSFELSVLVLFLLIIVFVFGAGKYSLDYAILSKVSDQEDPRMAIQRVQEALSKRRERVMEEIRIKRERAAGMQSSPFVTDIDSDVAVQTVEKKGTLAKVFYTILAYGILFSFLVGLVVLDVINMPSGLTAGVIVGGGIVVFLLMGMFFLIYGNALNETP